MRFCFLFCLLIVLAANSRAAIFTVTRSDDRNATCVSGIDCSLREAVAAANVGFSDDTINFAQGVTTIALNNAEYRSQTQVSSQ